MKAMDEIAMIPHFPKSIRSLIVSSSCPDTQEIAAYADGQLVGTEKHIIERHVASCNRCAEQIAFLVRSNASAEQAVPDALMAMAMRIGRPPAPRRVPNWRLAGASALVLIIAVIVTGHYVRPDKPTKVAELSRSSESHPNPSSPPTQTYHPELRGSEISQSPFLFPVASQTVDTTNLVFRWKTFPDADSYEIELLTDNGSFVWGEKVITPSVALPGTVHLVKGQTYFIKLSVHEKHGLTEKPKAIAFIAG
jgi:hypothetical protein